MNLYLLIIILYPFGAAIGALTFWFLNTWFPGWRYVRRQRKAWEDLGPKGRNEVTLTQMLKYTQRPGFGMPEMREYAMAEGILEPED